MFPEQFTRAIVSDTQNHKDKLLESDASVVAERQSMPGSDQIASYQDKIFIHTGKRLKGLDQGPVKAYAASASRDVPNATHFALVCEPHLIPRTRATQAYARLINNSLLKLIAAGPAYWPPVKSERYVLIYENFGGTPLMTEGDFRGLDMKSELVQDSIVRPLMHALVDMRNSDVVHGNIRPSNIFYTGSLASIDQVMLGDCLSTPPSYGQHVMFETIERAMADPISRGLPSLDTDVYSLGASLAVILRSRDPMEGMSADEIIKYKLEQGSYIALTGKDRFTGALLELLRGCLQDDQSQRWTLDDIMTWMDGQRLSPKPPSKKIKAARPVHFKDDRYFRPAILAMDLPHHQADAVQMIESGNLEQWVERSLEDSTILKRLEVAIETTGETGRGPGYWDRLICNVCIALDPEAPIRYKGLSMNPEGVSYALADAVVRKQDVQPYVDIINLQTVLFWLTAQGDTGVDIGALVSKFDNSRLFLKQQNIAYGIERCLYLLSPECPCLSEKLGAYYVQTPESLILALDKIAENPNRPALMLDRHSISFLSVKDRKNIDPFLMELNSTDMYKRVLGNLKVLATVQQRSQMGKLQGICAWFAEILDPVYDRFHDRALRVSMKEKINKLAQTGDLGKIAVIIDNPITLSSDIEGYNKARQEYYQLRVEDAKLVGKLNHPVSFSHGIGRQIAALLSSLLAGIMILIFVFMFFSGKSFY